jgi:hypothetical protein
LNRGIYVKFFSGILCEKLSMKPKVVVELLTLLLRTREIRNSNLGPETGYPD